jgi:hypothetical protein
MSRSAKPTFKSPAADSAVLPAETNTVQHTAPHNSAMIQGHEDVIGRSPGLDVGAIGKGPLYHDAGAVCHKDEKSETRSSKSEANLNDRKPKSKTGIEECDGQFGTFAFGTSDLFRISDFVLRIWP